MQPALPRSVLKTHLRQARRNAHLSQSALAMRAGVSRNTISSIETGQFMPTAKLALALCIVLNAKFEDLFYFEDAACAAERSTL